ncbi:MAG: 3-hydroxyacyl-CoA dehydrogenase family protein [Candidatus Geothermarchaeota archaeon]
MFSGKGLLRDNIDKACELGLNWPMGPLKLLDYMGLDMALTILEVLEKELDPKFRPNLFLKQMVRDGSLLNNLSLTLTNMR